MNDVIKPVLIDPERAIASYASQHEAFLRTSHPDMWRDMQLNGTLDEHCRRRGEQIRAFELRLGDLDAMTARDLVRDEICSL